jgi:methionyl-tRNA formyltransferase
VLQPVRLDEDARAAVRHLGAEMLVAFAYGKIFGPKFMGLFPEGGLNVHPSLLPKYRGPAPIPAVILAGESETGITVQYISQEMDAGAIVAQEHIALTGTETTETLTALVADKAGELLLEALSRIEEGTAEPVPQTEEEATYCKLIHKEDGEIDWGLPVERIERMVRAYVPWPGAYTYYGDQKLTIWEAAVYAEDATGPTPDRPRADSAGPEAGAAKSAASGSTGAEGSDVGPEAYEAGEEALATHDEPGHVLGVDKRWGILIQTGKGVLAVRRLQLQAGKAVDWKSFINGHRDFPGSVLGG